MTAASPSQAPEPDRPQSPVAGRRVLVARLDSDGDVLLAGPAVRAVAAAGRVVLWCSRRGRQAAELLPGVDEVLVHDAAWIDPDPRPLTRADALALVERLAALRVDQAIVLTSFHQSPLPAALLLRMAGVATVAACCEDYPGSLLDVRHRPDEGLHEVGRALSLVATLGYRLPPGDEGRLDVRRPAPPWCPPPQWDGYVVVHPGASVPARAWAPERNAALVDALVRRGRRVVVTGGPGETNLAAQVSGNGRHGDAVVDLAGRTTLAELAEVVAGADVVVVGNTGPAHLAAAVGTPVVSLFAPTVAVTAWRPWGVPCRLLGDLDIACGGCRARVCPAPGHPCLSTVAIDEVVGAVDVLSPAPAAAG